MGKAYNMVRLIFIFIITFLLASCGPNHYLRKAERALKKAEQLGAIITPDTVYKEIPVMVPEVHTDTVFQSDFGDTVLIEKERLKIKYVRLPGEKVYIEGECEADTVRVTVPVTVTREIKTKGRPTWWDFIIMALVCLLVGYGVRAFRG